MKKPAVLAALLLGTLFYQIGNATAPPCNDFVTGGGWFTWGDSIANFGFNAGYRTEGGALQGHLNYDDHNTGMHVSGTNVDWYTGWGLNDRAFHGDANVNGEPGFTYLVEVIDNAEPGRPDLFRIAVSNGYCANSHYANGGPGCVSFDFDGRLEGGNIQIHKAQACNVN